MYPNSDCSEGEPSWDNGEDVTTCYGRPQPRVYRFFKFEVWREPAGVISRDPIWVCLYDVWLHTHPTLWGLLWDVLRNHKSDHNLVA